jgi:hypothetical protein
MVSKLHTKRFYFPYLFCFLSVFICVHLWFQPSVALAQESRDQEIAVNLAEGRVVICAAKDAIILAAMSSKGEATSRPPAIEILSAERMGVMLGAVEWEQSDSKESTIRLDQEFRHIIAAAFNSTSKLPKELDANNDIETIGIALLERIRQVAELLRHKVNLGDDEPLIRIVLAGYVRDYGPEVWTIDYRIRQDLLGNDIWRTRVLRPVYNQLYPPEKGKPKTFMEVRYPPENRSTGDAEFLDLLQQNDSRLVKFRTANEAQTKSINLAVDGQSQKADSTSLINFMKSAFPAVTLPDAKLTMALVDYDAGFKWILQPPKAPAPPPGEKPKDQTPEEPERPSLRRSGGG